MAASIEIMEGEEKDAEEEEFGSLEEVCPEDPRTNLYLSMGGFHVQSVTHPPFGGLVTNIPKRLGTCFCLDWPVLKSNPHDPIGLPEDSALWFHGPSVWSPM